MTYGWGNCKRSRITIIKDLGFQVISQEAQTGNCKWCLLGAMNATKITQNISRHTHFLEYSHQHFSLSKSGPCRGHTADRWRSWALKLLVWLQSRALNPLALLLFLVTLVLIREMARSLCQDPRWAVVTMLLPQTSCLQAAWGLHITQVYVKKDRGWAQMLGSPRTLLEFSGEGRGLLTSTGEIRCG